MFQFNFMPNYFYIKRIKEKYHYLFKLENYFEIKLISNEKIFHNENKKYTYFNFSSLYGSNQIHINFTKEYNTIENITYLRKDWIICFDIIIKNLDYFTDCNRCLRNLFYPKQFLYLEEEWEGRSYF